MGQDAIKIKLEQLRKLYDPQQFPDTASSLGHSSSKQRNDTITPHFTAAVPSIPAARQVARPTLQQEQHSTVH
ncbi:hypothetical protein OEZ85_013525 [Tetradesmus obliquus]|uniref:Uncharacterized protein n=1 Tax=Tetradesmus obliquus TaxID=3088 RepID=A0ABY8URB0_TETOB|nr:hypothetical protein OEZ85_013525 [Tetradesmus obliquus]